MISFLNTESFVNKSNRRTSGTEKRKNKWNDNLKKVKTLYESYVDNIDELNKELIKSEKEYEMLKIQKMKEDEFNQFVEQVQIQYVTFLNDLKEYKKGD